MRRLRPWIAVVFVALAIPAPARAQWDVAGIRACAADSAQQNVRSVSDGAGGVILVWEDHRNRASTNVDLYAVRLLADGRVAPGWPVNGLVVCNAPGSQSFTGSGGTTSNIAADGVGGAIIVWNDFRAGASIYAQRVTSSGTALWTANGVAIVSTLPISSPSVVTGGDGGAIIVWEDNRSGNYDIFAQRLDASGGVAAGWPFAGVAACSLAGTQSRPMAISDGRGGAIIAFQSTGMLSLDIRAQRVASDGRRLWGSSGTVVSNPLLKEDMIPDLVPDGAGGAVIVWEELEGPAYAYAQRVDSLGLSLWTPNGIRVANTSPSGPNQDQTHIAADGLGGAYISLVRGISLIGQHLGPSGTYLWSPEGVAINAALPANSPRVIGDGVGGAIFTWSTGTHILASRFLSGGTLASGWLPNGTTAFVDAQTGAASARSVPDGTGGAIIAWHGPDPAAQRDINVQHMGADGTRAAAPAGAWDLNGSPAASASGTQTDPALVTDAEGGTIIVWTDYRAGAPGLAAPHGSMGTLGPGHARIFGTKLTEAGDTDPAWTPNGLVLANDPGNQTQPVAVADGSGGAITAWTDDRNGTLDIYAQHVLANSTIAAGWAASGLPVCATLGDQQFAVMATDGAGGAIVAWEDTRNGNSDIYAQRMRGNGTPVWIANGVAVCAAAGEQTRPRIAADGSGGAFITWSDDRAASPPGAHVNTGTSDIFALHADSTGARTAGWAVNGSPVCAAGGDQSAPVVIADGVGGAIFAWTDARGADLDVYALRTTADPVALWTTNGVAVCAVTGNQQHPRIATDGAGGVFVAWQDERPGSNAIDLYAHRVRGAGALDPAWPASGRALCTATGNQTNAQVVTDGQGGALVFWEDGRNGFADIYAIGVGPGGVIDSRWPVNGFPVSLASGIQTGVVVTTDGQGGAIVGWTDGRASEPDIYAMHLFGTTQTSPTAVEDGVATGGVRLRAPYPNPAPRGVAISFELASDAFVSLDVFDLSGRRVVRLADAARFTAGIHALRWNGNDDAGASVQPGVYFVRMESGGSRLSRRVALVR